MIDWMSTWAEQIIVAVIIAGIIEMILPSGNSKKYIKAVLGVYILFTIISPIIGKFTNFNFEDIDYEKYFEQADTYQTMSDSLETTNDKSVEEIYITNLKQDMKAKLMEKGYITENIDIDIILTNNQDYGKIKKISLNVYTKDENNDAIEDNDSSIIINKIDDVKIGNTTKKAENLTDKLENNEKNELKQYLSSVYDIEKKNIKINE